MQHDSGYHLLFSHPELVEDLMRTFVCEDWVTQLDFSTLERINTKLHADGLEHRAGDLIYRVKQRDGSDVYLYLLLEFQSQPDKWMAVRVLVYVGLLYQHLIREKALTPQGQLPPVFPLVLYNGDAPWTASTDLKQLIALPATTPLWSWQPAFRYYLLEENKYPDGKGQSIVGLLFQLENVQHPQVLRALLQEIDRQLPREKFASLRRAFTVWIKYVLAPAKGLSLPAEQLKDLSEVKDMLTTRILQWEQEILEKGLKQGIEQGEITLLTRLLERRFGLLPAWAQEKIHTADREQLEQWGLKVLDAKTLDEVFL